MRERTRCSRGRRQIGQRPAVWLPPVGLLLALGCGFAITPLGGDAGGAVKGSGPQRSAAAGNLWGWQITRCLYLLVVLTGSVGTKGGVGLHLSNKFVPKHLTEPAPADYWNELLFPREYPLAFFEMSFLLPHLLKEQRGKLDVYFTRVYNPLWTNPDGFSWMEMLTDRDAIGLHVALTPTWSETAWFADYILPMGLGTERHDTMSQETHAAQWLGFRQPVLRVARENAASPSLPRTR